MKFTIEYLDTASSTQDVVRQRLEADPSMQEGYVVMAKKQTRGYGRHGRTWESNEGNLYFSILLKPDTKQQNKIGLLALGTGLAVFYTLKPLMEQQDTHIKWPNDILVEGKKLSGILIESLLNKNNMPHAFIVGIGINIKSSPIKEATCLNDLSKKHHSSEEILDQFLKNFKDLYAQWNAGEFDKITAGYRACCIPKGQEISVKLPHKTHEGHYYDIDDHGNLILEKEDGSLASITSGDVYLCD
ncbi:MAG: biotin--[acetyl-CoA-carboxylase] ligase [Alphaproteobacteria bacterium]|nr:biotin--[acetyl-CoA-carboxylase] ligase [Alphaproteobacteria bacterium]